MQSDIALLTRRRFARRLKFSSSKYMTVHYVTMKMKSGTEENIKSLEDLQVQVKTLGIISQ